MSLWYRYIPSVYPFYHYSKVCHLPLPTLRSKLWWSIILTSAPTPCVFSFTQWSSTAANITLIEQQSNWCSHLTFWSLAPPHPSQQVAGSCANWTPISAPCGGDSSFRSDHVTDSLCLRFSLLWRTATTCWQTTHHGQDLQFPWGRALQIALRLWEEVEKMGGAEVSEHERVGW